MKVKKNMNGIITHAKEMAQAIIAKQQIIVKDKKEPIVKTKPITQTYNLAVTVTDQILELYKQTDYFPWTSFDMTNVGPSDIYFCVNQWLSSDAYLPVGQTINIDFNQKETIQKIYLKCNRGEQTKVMFYIRK